MCTDSNKLRHGFTLIEMIVSLGVFSVVLTITTGALLSLISSNQRYQNEQNVMTNLSFTLDSMTRELRTGFNYNCVSAANNSTNVFSTINPTNSNQEGLGTTTRSCPSGRGTNTFHGVSFYEGGNSISGASSKRILYFYNADDKKIYRKVGNSAPQSIVSESISIEGANFFVTDTDDLFTTGDRKQPTVTIRVEARARDATGIAAKVYYIQSSVTQRQIDL